MNREQALNELNRIKAAKGDNEGRHWEADKVLTDLLISLGYEDVVQVYEQIEPKWYA